MVRKSGCRPFPQGSARHFHPLWSPDLSLLVLAALTVWTPSMPVCGCRSRGGSLESCGTRRAPAVSRDRLLAGGEGGRRSSCQGAAGRRAASAGSPPAPTRTPGRAGRAPVLLRHVRARAASHTAAAVEFRGLGGRSSRARWRVPSLRRLQLHVHAALLCLAARVGRSAHAARTHWPCAATCPSRRWPRTLAPRCVCGARRGDPASRRSPPGPAHNSTPATPARVLHQTRAAPPLPPSSPPPPSLPSLPLPPPLCARSPRTSRCRPAPPCALFLSPLVRLSSPSLLPPSPMLPPSRAPRPSPALSPTPPLLPT